MTPPQVPGYRVLEQLGRGGMGSVFLVEPEALPGVRRALKLFDAPSGVARARFLREAATLARVDRCPGVVRVHDAGEHGRHVWICMDRIEGHDLERTLRERGPLPWAEAVRLVREVARGLAQVHARGIIHRDIKPSNIIVDAAGAPWLLDFGVALATDQERLTRTGALVGTPAYFAPEQASGSALDARADVYALGVTLFELLTGAPPFHGTTLAELLCAIVSATPSAPGDVRAGVPPSLDRAVLAALAKDPASRPADARAFAELLDACLTDPGRAAPRWLAPAAGAVCLVTLGLALVILRAQTTPSTPPASPAASTTGALRGDGLRRAVEALRADDFPRALRELPRVPPTGAGVDVEAAAAYALASGKGRALCAREQPLPRRALLDALRVVGRLRALAAPTPGGAEPDEGVAFADAVLSLVIRDAQDAIQGVLRQSQPGPALLERFGLLGDLADQRLLPSRLAGERAIDAVCEAYYMSALPKDAYLVALTSFVALDVDIGRDHVFRLPVDDLLEGSAHAQFVRLRALGEPRRELERDAHRAELRALVEGPAGDAFGPVARARAAWMAVGGLDRQESLALLEESRRLDPLSPYAPAYLAPALLGSNRDEEGLRLARAAIELFERSCRDRQLVAWEFLRAGKPLARSLVAAGALDDAERLLAAMRVPDQRLHGEDSQFLDEIEGALRDARARRP